MSRHVVDPATLTPGSPDWQARVSASKVAGIIGLSPYAGQTPYAIWHRMKGLLPREEQTRAMSRGHRLEGALLDWWLDEHPDRREVSRQPTYRLTDDDGEEWAIATPDMLVEGPDGYELVDAKTTADGYEWQDGPPAHYLASSLWQLACAPKAVRVHLAVLTGRPRLDAEWHVVERDDALIESIMHRCREFYDSLAADIAPDLSDDPAEYEVIRRVHADIDPDEVATLPDWLVDRYLLDAAHADRFAASKALVLDAMGRARLAKSAAGQTICRRQPKGDAVTLVRVAAATDLTDPTERQAS